MFNNFTMDKSLYITDERAPKSSIPKGAEKAGQYTHVTVVHLCGQSGMFHLWPPVTLGFFFLIRIWSNSDFEF